MTEPAAIKWWATPVMLWPDTFNNYFLPDTAKAAVEVLEAAGFRVCIPESILCCGRPLYDFGMLDRAKRLLLKILDALAAGDRSRIPIVVLEPSCAAVFRDELINLFPSDDRAQKLSRQTFLLSEFLEKKAAHFQLPNLAVKALIHGHCHHKSLMKMTDEESVLRKMGIDWRLQRRAAAAWQAPSASMRTSTTSPWRSVSWNSCRPSARPRPTA